MRQHAHRRPRPELSTGFRQSQQHGRTEMATATAASRKDAKERKLLPAPNSDFYTITDALTAEERTLVKQVRAFMETNVAPVINKYWADDAFPFEVLPAFKELNIGGLCLYGFGCGGGGPKAFCGCSMGAAPIPPTLPPPFGAG